MNPLIIPHLQRSTIVYPTHSHMTNTNSMTITEYFYQECSTPDDTNLLDTFVDLFSENWDKYTQEEREEFGEILRG